jgi:hypothetical protein
MMIIDYDDWWCLLIMMIDDTYIDYDDVDVFTPDILIK